MNSPKNIQRLAAPTEIARVETGAVQFGDDWPGLFIRGDNAHYLSTIIQSLASRLAQHHDPVVHDNVKQLLAISEIIETDVTV